MLVVLFWALFSTANFTLSEKSSRTILTKYLTTQGFQSQNVNLFFKKEKEKNKVIIKHDHIQTKAYFTSKTNTRQSLCKWLLLFLKLNW